MTQNPVTKNDWNQLWNHFNRMQKRVMADKTTKREFFAQPEKERLEFYNWLQNQCGSNAVWM